jgi:hypothetical protein
MATSRITLPSLLVAFIAGLVALHDAQNLLACLSGLALLVALFAYDQRGARTTPQSLAFAFVCGLALLVACMYPLNGLLAAMVGANFLPVGIWLIGTFMFFLIDRSRMGPRQYGGAGGYPQAAASAPTTIFPIAQALTTQQHIYTPVAPPAPPPVPLYQPQPAAAPILEPEPVYAAAAPQPTSAPAAAPPPPVLTGKEVSIYVNMLNEGMNMLRAVRAEHLGRDFYMIVDQMPADESWEYVPGQVVRCKKKNLSSGKGLVAYEEAPRAQ